MAIQAYNSAVRIITMPDEGVEAVKELIDGAKSTILIKMFEFDNEPLLDAVIAAHKRSVSVSILLNPIRSSGARPNDATFERLRNAGITVDWTSRHFKISHEKSLIVDNQFLLISTFNYSDKYFFKTRDYGVLIEDEKIIAEVAECFRADQVNTHFEPHLDSPLAWGNSSARRIAAHFIDEAEEHLLIQHPKFHDAAILEHVLAACARGVKVHLLCGGAHGIEHKDLLETFCHYRILEQAGVHIRKQRHTKLHAKLMVSDNRRAMVGSMNIDREAFDVRRELGIVLEDEDGVAILRDTFKGDWHDARSWQAPDPVAHNFATTLVREIDVDGIDHE